MAEHPLAPGTRVRHYGQQWTEARSGTGTIVRAKGPWPDGSYEYLVRTGENFANSTGPDNPENVERWWASHATIPVPTAPDMNATEMIIYAEDWRFPADAPVFRETVVEALKGEHLLRRNMSMEDSIRTHFRQVVAYSGYDAERGEWAKRIASDYEAGRLLADPNHPDAPSGYVDQFGMAYTNGDLHDIYYADLPDGS